MSKNDLSQNYADCLRDFCFKTLLHLYLTVSESKGLVPPKNRDAIVSKYIKPRQKEVKNKGIKSSIKMVLLSKQSKELQLIKMLNKLQSNEQTAIAEREWVEFLIELKFATGYEISIAGLMDDARPGTIYAMRDDIEQCVSPINGATVKPLSLYVYTSSLGQSVSQIVSYINIKHHYTALIHSQFDGMTKLELAIYKTDNC